MTDESTLRELADLLDEGAYIVDLDRRIRYWNPAAERITGYPADVVLGKSCADNLLRHVTADGKELCLDGCPLSGTMSDGIVRHAEVYLHHRDGHRVPVKVNGSPLRDESGLITGALEIFSDYTDRKDLVAELEFLRKEVLTDPLTKAGNRRYFELVAEQRLKTVQEGGPAFGLLMIDVDMFKEVNDTHGHLVGDRVLTMVAGTLGGSVRPLDAVVRWGGDEFVLVCPNVTPQSLADIAERVRMLVSHSWIELENGGRLKVTISMGGSISEPGDTLEGLVDRVDGLLRISKAKGRNRVATAG